MPDDTTFNPDITDRSGMQILQREELVRDDEPLRQAEMLLRKAEGVACPHCGAINEEGAQFCESCGKPLQMSVCPNCGSEIDPDADFCESCHRYIRLDVCSFCGASLTGDEAYCPECGSPRGGIVCPTCHTLNDFAFCKQCGTPLTDEGRMLMEQLQQTPMYRELRQLSKEYGELDMTIAYSSERDKLKDAHNEELRNQVLRLLAMDKGVANPIIPKPQKERLTKEELSKRKEEKLAQLAAILDKMEVQPCISPAKARNYAMAQKPMGVRLAWVCNFKHAMHSSPCACAKPQLGGKWVILGRNSKQELIDDNK